MRTLLLAALILLALAPSAAAQRDTADGRWIAMEVDASHAWSLDAESVRYDGRRYADAWTKEWFTRTQRPERGRPYQYELARWRIDCTEGRLTLTSSIRYREDGQVVESLDFDVTDDGWIYPPPDSRGEHLIRRVCRAVAD